jgi:ribosomal protein S18 acetylase RimI-like enzyme
LLLKKFMCPKSTIIQHNPNELAEMRSLILCTNNVLSPQDLEEWVGMAEVRARTRIWRSEAGQPIAFALVDPYRNLHFAIDSEHSSDLLQGEIIDWGVFWNRRLNQMTNENATLDASSEASDTPRIELLKKFGFEQEQLRTYSYERSMKDSITGVTYPRGFRVRPVKGEGEVEELVELHRSAFGTNQMTVEYRLSMMRTAGYDPALDLVLEAEGGVLAAFCICSIDGDENRRTGVLAGYTDPIGVRREFQRQGLGTLMLLSGMMMLQSRGMEVARLGTSSENIAMQRLAESTGFKIVSERLWFSKVTSD